MKLRLRFYEEEMRERELIILRFDRGENVQREHEWGSKAEKKAIYMNIMIKGMKIRSNIIFLKINDIIWK